MQNYKQALRWDSEFFGYPICKVAPNEAEVTPAELQDFVLLPSDEQLLIVECSQSYANNFNGKLAQAFSESKIVFGMDLHEQALDLKVPDYKIVRDLSRINEVYYLALESGHSSRFNLDPKMNRSEFEKLYFEWVFKSVKSEFDDELIVVEEANEFVGLISLKYAGDGARVGLLTAHPKHQGKGIGRKLVSIAIDRAKAKKSKKLFVATQGSNEGAVKFYNKCGFSVFSNKKVIHLWKNC